MVDKNKNKNMNQDNFEEIKEEYEYDEKIKRTDILFFPDEQIATITHTVEDEEGISHTKIIAEGMTSEELECYFPPLPPQANKGRTYNMAKIIRSIIYEAYRKEGSGMEQGNVRNFWYTHLKRILTKILGLQENDSVVTSINTAWGEMINSALVTYEGMNIIGGKESTRISIVKDSPFSNLVVAVEKEDFFLSFKWIPLLFNCTLITAGGQPSRAVARAFIKQLVELGVDLDQQFYMCVVSDLDPAGYYIQDAFRKQLEAAIRYYGGSGKVAIRRLFVRKDQVSPELLESEAMPCRDIVTTEKARKAEDKKWEFFCKQADGGLYISVPPNWDGSVYEIDGEPMVRALLEMNAFGKRIIENAILRELLKIIEETSDESKIMIPEIMRVFEIMRNEAIDDVYSEWHGKLIQPLIDKFLEGTRSWELDIDDRYYNERSDAREKRDEARFPIDERYNEMRIPINEKYDGMVKEKKRDAYERVPDLFDERAFIEFQIKELQAKLVEVKQQINHECKDIYDEIDAIEIERNKGLEAIESERDKELQPIKDEYEEGLENIEACRKYRKTVLQRFKEEHATIFNPMEMALKSDIAQMLSPSQVIYFFKDIEMMIQFQGHISKLLSNSDLLLEKGISCFEHPAPTFIEENLLKKASEMHEENVEKVRKAFVPKFLEEMKNLVIAHTEGVEFEIKEEVETADLSKDIKEAMSETEENIESEEIE